MEPSDIISLIADIIEFLSIAASVILVFISSKLYNQANFRSGMIDPGTIKVFYVQLNAAYDRYFLGEKAGTTEAYLSFSNLLRETMENVAVLRFADKKKYDALISCLTDVDDALSINKNRPMNFVQKQVDKDLFKLTKLFEKYYSI